MRPETIRRGRGAHRVASHRNTLFLLILIGGITLFIVASAFGASGETEVVSLSRTIALDAAAQPIAVSERTGYVFTLGAMAAGAADVTATFASGQTYDFVVTKDGEEIWRWSDDRVFHQALNRKTYEPAVLHTASVFWDGRDADGRPVTGTVQMQAFLLTTPDHMAAEPVTIHMVD